MLSMLIISRFICASPLISMNSCQRLRTYRPRGSRVDYTLAEAVCASMALSPWFSPISIGNRLTRRTFAGVGNGFHNPTQELLKEAETIFGSEARVSCLINLGSGSLNEASGQQEDESSKITRVIAQECEMMANQLLFQHSASRFYYRLSANCIPDVSKMMSFDDDIQERVVVQTIEYLELDNTSNIVNVIVEALKERQGRATLSQISE